MINAHIAHDCQIKNRCILANNATLAGHVELDDFCHCWRNVAIHQFADHTRDARWWITG